MADLGTLFTDKETAKVEKKINAVYKEAAQDIQHKMDDFTAKHQAKAAKYAQQVADGKITQEQYDAWMRGQVFQGEQWKNKQEQILGTIHDANGVAARMVAGSTFGVFSFNSNYMAYSIEHSAGVNFGFGLYDTGTVMRLIKDNPQILPKYNLDKEKDYVWNARKLRNAVTQGIIQGEGFDKISKRVANSLSTQNSNTMKTFARTSMTSAQNAGRLTRMHEAKSLGINIKKQWMATLDGHTRDTHRDMDGEIQELDKKSGREQPFSNGCMYPADPHGDPAEVYNCRCTLVEYFEEYPAEYQRYDNIQGQPIENMTYREWEKLKSESADLYNAKLELAKVQRMVNDKVGIHKTFVGIWKDPVTYADWEQKKGGIIGKQDYYDSQIASLEQTVAADPSAQWAVDKLDNMKQKQKELAEFEKHGAEYSQALQQLAEAKKKVRDLTPAPPSPFGADAYSKARKDAAVWAKSSKEADSVLREKCGEVWRSATKEERLAIYEYTQSYHKFNEPLRGIEYGTSRFLGVGNTDLNAGYADNGEMLNAMTRIISRSTYEHDQWFQRGCGYSGMEHFFDCSEDLLRYGTQEELEAELLGKTVTEWGFMSMGSSRGRGFSGDILLNVYTPSGTKMMYVEPFSRFGMGDGKRWDGISEQSSFGSELETILQQGTQFRVVKIERTTDTLYFDIEVIAQDAVQVYTP